VRVIPYPGIVFRYCFSRTLVSCIPAMTQRRNGTTTMALTRAISSRVGWTDVLVVAFVLLVLYGIVRVGDELNPR